MSVRHADKAGSWYKGKPAELQRELGECLRQAEEKFGPLPSAGQGGERPVGAVVPHAGLVFSGSVAATAYKRILDAAGRVDTFLVFGACHRARLSRPAVWAGGAWETPLGPVEIDSELAELLVSEGIGEENESAHLGDNAIELQTPFIKAMFPEARMTPVAMGFFPDAWRTGERAAEAIAASGSFKDKIVVALASTDLTHYGASFGVMPAGTGRPALEWARRNDARFLDSLVELRVADIVPVANRDQSACGAGAGAAVAGWAKAKGCRGGRLLAYATSYDIFPEGEAEHFVGYGSVIYETGKTP